MLADDCADPLFRHNPRCLRYFPGTNAFLMDLFVQSDCIDSFSLSVTLDSRIMRDLGVGILTFPSTLFLAKLITIDHDYLFIFIFITDLIVDTKWFLVLRLKKGASGHVYWKSRAQ